MEGTALANHTDAPTSYISNLDPGRFGGGTFTGQQVEPTLEAYENIFGPSARDIKQDLQRFKRHGRWHLPDILKGPNQYLTDRVDGLITDATNSPFTSRILPYKYITNVDGKIKWNVWSFDEGLASRVPYESAARTLTQSKRSYAGYTIRQGMAIVLEHNFMMTEAGRTNFRNQLNQLIGSIQLTNDLDVHVALVLAPSYQKTMQEKYLTNDKTPTQICREFVDMFGFVQKNQNALDILIEEAKGLLKTWGAPMPNFMLCNSKLTFQLTMIPDVTNYVANGPEGAKRLRSGPDLPSYRGIQIIHTRAFSMETGAPPRDILRRRVRVAEYYRILPHKDNHRRLFQLYNEERDTWSTFTFGDLLLKANCEAQRAVRPVGLPGVDNNEHIRQAAIGLAGQAAADHADPMHPAAAPALGVAMHRTHDALTADLTTLFTQIFEKKLRSAEFVWQPEFLHPHIVYVPGVIDRSLGTAYDDLANDVTFNTLPVFIKQALHDLRDELTHRPVGMGARAALPIAEQNEITFKIQSVAQYPRNLGAFVRELKPMTAAARQGDRCLYNQGLPFPAEYMAVSGVAGGVLVQPPATANAGRAQHFLKFQLAARNFMRYGVPKAPLMRGGVAWGSNWNTYAQVFDLNLDLANPANNNHLNQHLRNKGAFFCPNHFKGPAPVMRKLSDYAGYHVLVTSDLVDALTHQNPLLVGDSQYTSAALYDIVTNPVKYRELLEETAGYLNATKAGAAAAVTAGIYSQANLTADLNHLIIALINRRMIAPPNHYTADSKQNLYEGSYWTWPASNDVAGDIFASAQPWAVHVRASPGFHESLMLTGNVVDDMVAPGGGAAPCPLGTPLTRILDQLTACTDATAEDAVNFYHMLAWRLWADQEIPLTDVAPVPGMWPPVAQYLHPNLYPHANFGGTVMAHDPHAYLPGGPGAAASADAATSERTRDIEIVIVRPNIEHYMLGIILGQGGESLGSTFWGQTELSCYDDSMHGIWGMSYKYNERAIVINERNLVRLWDIAYDGYVGGKEDSAVDWNDDDPEHPHSLASLGAQTMDVTRAYRGPSMMVMAFNHRQARTATHFRRFYEEGFKPNWPSPIVFFDRLQPDQPVTLPMDFDNIHVTEANQFRVFHRELYRNGYAAYKEKMPDFWELHKIRKNAGLAAVENEVSSEALAFQGTMRTLSADNGQVVSETMGSGHHGPDFVGVASLRAGKGYKINSQPTLQRTI